MGATLPTILKSRSWRFYLFLILALGLGLRLYGLNWDQGFHLHPDERWIVMVVEKLSLQNLNPEFFAYGSLPLYILSAAGWLASIFGADSVNTYTQLNLLGRFINALFDTATIFVVFKLGQELWSRRVGLLSSFFYAVAVFPIQNAHFYTVDTQLTFWVTLTLYLLLRYLKQPGWRYLVLSSASIGLAAATKISGIFLLAPFLVTLGLQWLQRPHQGLLPKFFLSLLIIGLAFAVAEPYALLDFSAFQRQLQQQTAMRSDATVFPYTIQYLGTRRYLYPLEQIIKWGLGPFLGLAAMVGVLYWLMDVILSVRKDKVPLIIFAFVVPYFAIMGSSAVKFMRYYLPLYPFLILGAGFLVYRIYNRLTQIFSFQSSVFILSTLLLTISTWTAMFLTIYSQPHTRVQATNWINQNIPAGTTIAVEHWDDRLPLQGAERYNFETLELYQPDSEGKVDKLNQQLSRSDYLVIASKRLYKSIPRWPQRYPQTIKYYEDLFSGKLNFRKVAEFSSYPAINDDNADESFTVYDHPKVLIFKQVRE